ncbi:MAG: TIR domain-containing protein, partial [Candidatus Lokiarchaeota archaeon]|nr:TIR domain-containing protein [Candidatus Lokiarchaeota archaeon]
SILFHEKFDFDRIGAIIEDEKIYGLNLCGLELDKFPKSILDFKNLIYLDLSHNRIEELPLNIANLISLKFLDLRFNRIEMLPDSIGNLKNLQVLSLSNNLLTGIPNTIGELKKLKRCDLNDNMLSYLPKSFGSLNKLKVLSLWNNKLGELKDTFGNLKSLKNLNLRGNELERLPESFSNLESLEKLNISKNKLIELPESFGTLKVLKHLFLNNNKLSNLPETMGNLNETLETLYLKGNEFKNIPAIIWPLKKLVNFNLDGDTLDDDSKELLSGEMNRERIRLILDYCRKRANIRVFISHEMGDFSKYKIDKIAEILEKQAEIYYTYYCERDMKKEGDIISFMIDIIPTCQIMISIITDKYIKSKNCNFEIELAQSYGVKIIPILGADVNWNNVFLKDNSLFRELGFKYNEFRVKNLCKEIYEYIIEYKKEKNIYAEKYKMILSKIKKNFKKIVKNKIFQATLKKRMYNIQKILQDYEDNQLDDLEYLNKISEIFVND